MCLEGAGLCMCDTSAHNDYEIDGSSLTYTLPHPDITAGALIGVGIEITQAAQSSIESSSFRNTLLRRETPTGSITFAGCIADVEIRTVYYVVGPESPGGFGSFRCDITQSFEGVTSFEVLAPTIDLAAETCVATGLRAR